MRRAIPDLIAAAAVALLMRLALGSGHPGYDALYALVWGDELAGGRSPELEVEFAPAAHPLFLGLGALVSPLGDAGAADAMHWLGFLFAGVLVVGVFRLGQAVVSWQVGLLAAVIVATREPTLALANGAFVDLPAAALVVWAGVLEARSPRRGAAVLALLVPAGLLRPEVWLFAGAYWIWCATGGDLRRSVRLGALVAAGPLLWALFELAVSGDPLRPITEKNADPAQVGADSGFGGAPEALVRDLGAFLQAPFAVMAVVGLVLGLLFVRGRIAIPAALVGLNAATFLVLAGTGQVYEQRYLLLAAVGASLLAAVVAGGWAVLPESGRAHGRDARARWSAAGIVAFSAALTISVPSDFDRASDLRDRARLADTALDDLADIVERPAVERALDGNRPVHLVTASLVPFVAQRTGTEPGRLEPRPTLPGEDGVLLLPETQAAEQMLVRSLPDPDEPVDLRLAPPPGWTLLVRNGSWSIHTSVQG